MAQFIEVPAVAIETFLQSMKFERTVQGREVVYRRRSAYNRNVWLKVYTSITVGSASVRSAGRDAVRVCCIFDNGVRSFGIGKFSPVFRVHSVESVLARLFERLQEATKRAREWMTEDDSRSGITAEAQTEWQQRMDEKRAYAKYEAAQDELAYKREALEEQALANERREASSQLSLYEDPCSEPPPSGLSCNEYVARL